MSPADWKKIEDLFIAVADLDPEARSNVLDVECAGNDDLRAEIDRLIAGDESAGEFIESPIWTDSLFLNTKAKSNIATALKDDKGEFSDFYLGRRIGSFLLVKEIGRGGMGAVYLAERDDLEFAQKAAIKIIKRGMDSEFIIRRFKHERQILASFEHPNIARLLDGGTTDDGVPYFVMEFIEGETLYNYCDNNRLDINARINIFKKIASAVKYAHSRQIIHRDIKPNNILVNNFGSPKLLDFGIAKILDPDLIHESINPTASMLRMMTPDYASPEQVEGRDVTPESDVYSLGVLLYELLSGHRPYDLSGRSLNELTKIVCEEMPTLPSDSVGTSSKLLAKYHSASEIALFRNTSPEDLKNTLAGNLDNIIIKALAKSPDERYTSVDVMLLDIDNHIRGGKIGSTDRSSIRKDNKFSSGLQLHPDDSKAVAVLPFRFIDLAGQENADERFIGFGLADALIARLSKIKRLVVRPTGSMLPYDKDAIDPIRAGIDLNVSFVLDGNIKKANERLRVSVQLLDVANNATVWATSIDETISDVLTLEDTLANKVIESLLPQLTAHELKDFSKRGTNVPEAFEHYIRGRYYFNTFTEEGFAKAFVSFHKAIAADNSYALAYAGIADYYNWLGIIGVLEPQDCFQNAISAASKAVEIDSSLSDGHASLGFSLHAGNYDCERPEHHLLKAIDLNPNNANAYVWYSLVLYTQARFDEGMAFAEKAIEIDPMTPFNHHAIGWGYYFAGRFDESEKKYKTMIAEFPDNLFGYYGLAKVYRITGRSSLALRTNVRAHDLMGRGVFTMLSEAECLAADGQQHLALQMVRQLTEMSTNRFVSPYGLALVHIFLGDMEKTFAQLEKAYDKRDPWLNWLWVEPAFVPIRNEERFLRLTEKIDPIRTIKDSSATETGRNKANGKNGTFYEQTTEIISKTSITHSSENPQKDVRSYANYLITAVILIAFLFGTYFFFTYLDDQNKHTSTAALKDPKIIVLPFISENEENINLGIGLADALTSKLGNIHRLQVLSSSTGRTAASISLDMIRSETGANFLVKGILKSENGTPTLSTDLIDLTSGRSLWSGNISTDKKDLFSLQTELAERIWETLGIEPLPLEKIQIQKSHTHDPEAYELYLIGRSLLTKRTANDLKTAIATFGDSLKKDPEFAHALVGLADAYALLNLYDISPPVDAYKIASSYVNKALMIDEGLAEAHATSAYIKFYADRDTPGAELDFRRSLQLNPSLSQTHHWFALFLAATGKPVEATQEIETARMLDPKSYLVGTAKAMVSFYAGDPENAIRLADDVLQNDPSFVPALKVKRWAYSALKDHGLALDVFKKELNYSGGDENEPGWQIIAAQVNGLENIDNNDVLSLNTAVNDPLIRNNLYTYAYEIALAYNTLGRTDKALEYLGHAESLRSYGVNFIGVDVRFANLRNDTRFQKLVDRIKN